MGRLRVALDHRVLRNWLLPFMVASALIIGLHPGVHADPAPSSSQLALYLQQHQLELTTTVTDGYQQIYYAFNGRSVQLTHDGYNHTYAQASGPYVVWEGVFSGGGQIYLYNVLTNVQTQLTTIGTNSQPALFGNQVTWREWDGQHWQVDYYDGAQIKRLTSGDHSSVRASTNGLEVLYSEQVGPNDWMAQAYDISTSQTRLVQRGDEVSTAYPAFGPNGTITTSFVPY